LQSQAKRAIASHCTAKDAKDAKGAKGAKEQIRTLSSVMIEEVGSNAETQKTETKYTFSLLFGADLLTSLYCCKTIAAQK